MLKRLIASILLMSVLVYLPYNINTRGDVTSVYVAKEKRVEIRNNNVVVQDRGVNTESKTDIYNSVKGASSDTQSVIDANQSYASGVANNPTIKGNLIYRPNMHYYNQADAPWGSMQIAGPGTTYQMNGCGPTSLAMVVRELNGDTTVDPIVIGKLVRSLNLMIDGAADHNMPLVIGEHYGLKVRNIEANAVSFAKEIRAGNILIGVVRNGKYFKGYGHYILVTGIDEEGRFRVHDPGARAKTGKWHEPEILTSALDGKSWRAITK